MRDSSQQLSKIICFRLFIDMIDMTRVREKGVLETSSPTTTGKRPGEDEIKAAQQLIFASNQRIAQPIVEHLIRNHDSACVQNNTRSLTQLGPSMPSSRDDLSISLANGQQSISLNISNYKPGEVHHNVSVDLESLQPPNPKLIRNIGNTLVPVTIKLSEHDAKLLEQIIRQDLARQSKQEKAATGKARSLIPAFVTRLFS